MSIFSNIHKSIEALKNTYRILEITQDIQQNIQIYNEHILLSQSYSQFGEDRILLFLLSVLGKPFSDIRYLDIGCNDWKNYNNTYLFYLLGARGVLIDANPMFSGQNRQNRPKDTVINVGVGAHEGELDFYIVTDGSGLSTFDKKLADKIMLDGKYPVDRVEKVSVTTIETIFSRYFDSTPDLIDIDVEGLDLDIIKSIDFGKRRPSVFIVETHRNRADFTAFMSSKEYSEYAFSGVNSIFIDNSLADRINL